MSETFARLQRALPQHLLSRLVGRLARSELPWIKAPFINTFARIYHVSLEEAQCKRLRDYASFNAFFTRALEPGARPVAEPGHVCAPADGTVSQVGRIRAGSLVQAKGQQYTLGALVHDERLAAPLAEGEFVTIYLAPSDYHRVHTPLAGTVRQTIAVPGALFSVNAATETAITGLFCRNERLVCAMDTSIGPVVVVLVAAMIVAGIELAWTGPGSPYRDVQTAFPDFTLGHGAELGRFLLGSTVICCFPPGAITWSDGVGPGARVRVGQGLATLNG